MDLEFSGDADSRDRRFLHIVPRQQAIVRPLPRALTTLIGRDNEIAHVVGLFREGAVRLVTLTGAGGIGKTRVAMEVAATLAREYRDGVHWVSLAPIRSEPLVAPAIANQLGLPETAGFDAAEALLEFLEHKHALLVLDNFEHVLDSTGLLTDLLNRCPRLSLLVTSRATLRISAEHEIRLLPLPVPDRTSDRSFDDKRATSSIRLFTDRARSTYSDLSVDQSNIDLVIEICRKLDGLPLAIELAAARTKYLTLPSLLRRLEHRLGELDRGFSDVPDRHKSIRATIDWSHDLLTTTNRWFSAVFPSSRADSRLRRRKRWWKQQMMSANTAFNNRHLTP